MRVRFDLVGRREARLSVLQAPPAAGWLDRLPTLDPDRLPRALRKLAERRDPNEAALVRLSGAQSVEVTSGVGERRARRLLRWFARREQARHLRALAVNVSLLPVTALMTVLPGPNVFFFWNAYRTMLHWSCLRGSGRLLKGTVREEPQAGPQATPGAEPQTEAPRTEALPLPG